jgi:hypothetical protein
MWRIEDSANSRPCGPEGFYPPALDPSPVIPSDLSFGYLSAELKSLVKIPILDAPDAVIGSVHFRISGKETNASREPRIGN